MSNIYHLPIFRKLRSFARQAGILKFVKPMVASRQKSYEEAFHEALKEAVRQGDVVWDVGANVGVYTKLFLEWAGPQGKVVAFEPLPRAIIALTSNVKSAANFDNLVVEPVALAEKTGSATFAGELEGESVTTTGHLTDDHPGDSNSITVEVATADFVVAERSVPPPTVVKIDVEGFEEDVLNGGHQVFGGSSCREILVEMHFTRMDERGLGDAAERIVRLLKSWNYRVAWVDPSHIHAKR